MCKVRRVRLKDGFPGERLRVLPRPTIGAALASDLTSRLLVTDAGYFPTARLHGRQRKNGADGAILIVCTRGVGHCRVGDRLSTVGPGQALVIPPNLAHAYWADDDDPWTIWWLHVVGGDLPHFFSTLGVPGDETVVDLHDPYRAVELIESAVAAMERDDTLPNLLTATGAGFALLALLAADRAAGSPGGSQVVRQAQDHLRRNLAARTSVPELARTASLSVPHFSALFRAATGGGVVEYTKRLRMARACELLLMTSRGVAEIAESVGYPDPFYFSRQFRTVHGTSPTTYRDQHARDSLTPPPRVE